MRVWFAQDIFIDSGSERTVVAIDSVEVFNEVTCIAYYPGSNVVVAIGQEAQALKHSGQDSLKISWPIRAGRVAEPVSAQLFLQSLLQRADAQIGLLGKLIGYGGRYSHPTSVSPAELHTFKKVYSVVGLGRLQATAVADALITVAQQLNIPSPFCGCMVNMDWVEISVYSGSGVISTTEIEWGVSWLHDMIRRVILREYECIVSERVIEQILQTLIDCTSVIDGQKTEARKNIKVSVKAVDVATSTSKTLLVSQAVFHDELQKILMPLADGIKLFLEDLEPELLTNIHSTGLRLFGRGAMVSGLDTYLSHTLDTEIVLFEKPEAVVSTGLQLLQTAKK